MLKLYSKYIMRTIISLTLCYNISISQWSELVLPSRTVPFHSVIHPMGNDCMIFAIKTSNTVYGFDQNSKVWSEYTANTSQNWITGYGGGNVGIVLNDSVAVAYSSVLSQFKELRFNGTLLSLPGSGWTSCGENSGVIITTERIYIYDALTNTWHSTEMNEYSILEGFGNHIQDDFLYIILGLNNGNMKVVAYSLITKSFAEITKENFPIKRLDHGFCILAYTNSPYIAGYSAFTGVFNEITSSIPSEVFYDSSPQTDKQKVSEIILQMFHKVSAMDGEGNVTMTTYVYNTLTGQFYSDSYTYNYVNTSWYIKVGGKFTALAMYVHPAQKVTLKIFRASDNSFYTLDVPIYIIANTPGCLTVGKDVFWIWDNTHLVAVNTTTGAVGQVSFGDSFATLPTIQVNMAGDDWGVWAYQNTGSDVVKIYYFSGNVTNIGYKEVQASSGASQAQYDKIGFLTFQDAGSIKKWSAYSPTHNVWRDFEPSTSWSDNQTVPGNYAYVNYYSKSSLELYDAVTNDARIYPILGIYTYKTRNHLAMYNNSTAQYIGYSAVEHNDQICQVDQYYGLYGVDDIVVITPYGTLYNIYTRIIYDGYRNNFAGLKIADSLGTAIIGGQSGKICFFATMTGHVFAYNGNDGNIVDVEHLYNNVNVPVEFSLKQNYPNPFNPSTVISWQLPVSAWVTLKVYDILGREVATLVDENRKAGSYKVQFDGSKLSSGVYFYQLKAKSSDGVFIQTKKLILIK